MKSKRILLAAHHRILPFLAIGAFAGIRSAEIQRLDWSDIKWERGHIEIAGKKAKTATRPPGSRKKRRKPRR